MMSLFSNDFLLLVPEFYFLFCIIFLFSFNLIGSQLGKYSQSLLSVDLSLWVLVLVSLLFLNNFLFEYLAWTNLLYSTRGVGDLKMLVLLLSILTFVFCKTYFQDVLNTNYELAFLLLTSLFASLLILSSNDFILLIIFLEIQSFCFYILTSLKKTQRSSAEAGMKYFIIGSVGGGLMLFGISLLYGVTGTFNLSDLHLLLLSNELVYNELPLIVSFSLICIGLLIKMGGAPFHFWVADAYQGAPRIITAFFLLVPKIVYFVVLLNLYLNVWGAVIIGQLNLLAYLFFFIILSSFVFGGFGTLGQEDIKRLLAFSSVVHIAFILLGLVSNVHFGAIASLFYLLVYVNIVLGILGILFLFRYKKLRISNVNEFLSLATTHPVMGFILVVNLFSLIGIPPFSGFFSKASILYSLLCSEYYLLAILVIGFSSLSAVYYLRIGKVVYFELKFKQDKFLFVNWFNRSASAYIVAYSLLLNVLFVCYADLFWYPLNNILFKISM